MEVYILDSDANNHQSLALVDEDDWDLAWGKFDGTPVGESWTPLRVEIPADEHNLPPSDFPALGYIPAFSDRAVDSLRQILDANGEVLPLECEQGDYFAYNVTSLSDALDEAASDVERFETDGRIMEIDRYEFRPDALEGLTIFKLSVTPDRYEYVTDQFVTSVRDAGLVGFKFDRKVWSGG
jgi:hypothetical protein